MAITPSIFCCFSSLIGFTLSIPTVAEAAMSGYMMLRATKTNHGLTDGWIGLPTGTGFSADL